MGQQRPVQPLAPAPAAADPNVEVEMANLGERIRAAEAENDRQNLEHQTQLEQMQQTLRENQERFKKDAEAKDAWAEKQLTPAPTPKRQPEPLPEDGDFGRGWKKTAKNPLLWLMIASPIILAAALSKSGISSTEKSGELAADMVLVMGAVVLAMMLYQMAKKGSHNWTKASNALGAFREYVSNLFKSEGDQEKPAPQHWMNPHKERLEALTSDQNLDGEGEDLDDGQDLDDVQDLQEDEVEAPRNGPAT